jgi:hypothetical protein
MYSIPIVLITNFEKERGFFNGNDEVLAHYVDLGDGRFHLIEW